MLENYLLIGLVLMIAANLVYSLIITKFFKKVKKGIGIQLKEEELAQLKSEVNKDFEEYKKGLEKDYQNTLSNYSLLKQRAEQELKLVEQHTRDVISNEQRLIKVQLDSYRETELEKIKAAIKEETEQLKTSQEEFLNYCYELNKKSLAEVIAELNETKATLEDYRVRREAINEAIIREKELQEKESFYKINISDNDIEDIKMLRDLSIKFHNRDVLNKAIYECYIKKPLLEMEKRVLGKTVSGIYKITYIKTGESYIGKSTDVAKRWVEHAKSVFDIGSIAHALVHTRMKRDGIWNFTWELIEAVDKTKLNEREKYWIEFYETKTMGMNEKGGG